MDKDENDIKLRIIAEMLVAGEEMEEVQRVNSSFEETKGGK